MISSTGIAVELGRMSWSTGGDDSQVIYDHDSNAHVVWKMLQQSRIRVEAASRAADADDGKVLCSSLSDHHSKTADQSS